MRDFIITAIIALAAAKARAQAENNLNERQPGKSPLNGPPNHKEIIDLHRWRDKMEAVPQYGANPVFNDKKHLIRKARL